MFIWIDIGWTFTKIVVVRNLQEKDFLKTENIPTHQDFKKGVAEIFKILDDFWWKIDAIWISIAWRVCDDSQELVKSNNLPDWANKSIKSIFQDKFNCPVFLENDAISQWIAEKYSNSVINDFAYIVWGTWIWGVIMLNRQMVKFPKGYLQKWEDLFWGCNLEKRFDKNISEVTEDEWLEVIWEFLEFIKNTANILDIKNIVIAGWIVKRQEEKIEEKIQKIKTLRISISKLNDNIGAHGAIALIKHRIQKS